MSTTGTWTASSPSKPAPPTRKGTATTATGHRFAWLFRCSSASTTCGRCSTGWSPICMCSLLVGDRPGHLDPPRRGVHCPRDRSAHDLDPLAYPQCNFWRGACGKAPGPRKNHLFAGPRRPVARTTPGGFMTQTSTFDLPARHAAKAAPQRITRDDAHFATIAEALSADIADVEHNLETALSQQTGDAAGRVERDARVKHFQNRLKGLRSFQLDAVLGRMTPADGTDPVYVGRLAVHDQDGKPLLVDW